MPRPHPPSKCGGGKKPSCIVATRGLCYRLSFAFGVRYENMDPTGASVNQLCVDAMATKYVLPLTTPDVLVWPVACWRAHSQHAVRGCHGNQVRVALDDP